MRFLVLGASGRTGQLIVEHALKQGHKVTALVRKASSMKPQRGLEIVQGTPSERRDIERAFAATPSEPVNCVIVALNAPRASDSPFAKPLVGTTFIQDCVRNAMAVMEQYRIRRLVMMSAFGMGSSWSQMPWLTKALFTHTNMSYTKNDHDATDAEIRKHGGLDWTLVRPQMLKNGGALPVRELGELGEGSRLWSGITRASVAEFLVMAATDEAYVKKAVVISN